MQIEAFTCITYDYSKETSVNVFRSKILKKMVDKDSDLTKESKVNQGITFSLPGLIFFHICAELTIE